MPAGLLIQNQNQNPDIFRNLAYSEPEAYSEPRFIKNPSIFRTMQKLRHTQSSGIFRTLVYSEPEACSELETFSELWNIENQ